MDEPGRQEVRRGRRPRPGVAASARYDLPKWLAYGFDADKLEAKVAERAAKEEALTKERKDKAERDLDTFYDQNTDKKAQKQASNRDHDDELKAMLERPVPANPFEKVVELIGGAQADVDNEDTSIMRRLLVRLKNDPKRSNDVDMDALGSS